VTRLCFVLAAAVVCRASENWAQVAADAQRAKDYNKAATAFVALINEGNASPELMSNAGVMLYMAGRDAEAAPYLRRALHANPNLVSAQLFLGLSLLRSGDPAAALPLLQRVVELQPEAPLPLLGLARSHVALRHIAAANNAYFRASQLDPASAEAWYGLGITYRSLLDSAVSKLAAVAALRNVAAAMETTAATTFPRSDFEQVMKRTQTKTPAPGDLAQLAIVSRSLSLSALSRAMEIDPDSEQAHLLLAESLRDNGKLMDAVREYEAVIRRHPASVAGYLGLAVAYWKAGETDTVWAPLNEVLRISPREAQAHTIAADLLSRSGEYEKAKEHVQIAGREVPVPDQLRVVRAKIYMSENRPDAAIAELEPILSSDTTGQRHYMYARGLRQLGRNEEAEKALATFRRLKSWSIAAGASPSGDNF